MSGKIFLFLVVLTSVLSGCVSQSRYDTDVGALRSHTAILTEQVTQLDAALRQAESDLSVERAAGAELREQIAALQRQAEEERAKAGPRVYRTAAGFELPPKDIQTALKNAGYYKGEIDEKIGPDSREAIRAFQRDHDLAVDGICGAETWEKLKPYLSAMK